MYKYFLKCSRLLRKSTFTLEHYYVHANLIPKCERKILIRSNTRNFCEKKELKFESTSLDTAIQHWKKRFENEGISEPIQSIENIIAHLLGIDKLPDLLEKNGMTLTEDQLKSLEELCVCRLSRMPVQYIIGEWDFCNIKLKLEPPVFIPRPETESLVDLVLEKLKKDSKILEVGCGSGAISLSILHKNKQVNKIVAIDANPHACKLTLENAQKLNLDDRIYILTGNLKKDGTVQIKGNPVTNLVVNIEKDKFDIIVSNPPYVPTKRLLELQPEIILYEDIRALDGGEDGLELIKSLITYASEALNVGGFLILEVDSEHPKKIESFVEESYTDKLRFVRSLKDYCDKDRFVEIERLK